MVGPKRQGEEEEGRGRGARSRGCAGPSIFFFFSGRPRAAFSLSHAQQASVELGENGMFFLAWVARGPWNPDLTRMVGYRPGRGVSVLGEIRSKEITLTLGRGRDVVILTRVGEKIRSWATNLCVTYKYAAR